MNGLQEQTFLGSSKAREKRERGRNLVIYIYEINGESKKRNAA
jgi:hypothetical protein